MGGSGSGRWGGHRKKRTVESCACLSVAGGKIHGTLPRGVWRMEYEKRGDVCCVVLRGEQNGWQAEEWIEVLFWKPQFGGAAFWMLCPGCGRKCRKLYAPPGMASFRCRACWNLAYESSQEAHSWDRGIAATLLAPLYAAQGIPLRKVEKIMRAESKARREARKRNGK